MMATSGNDLRAHPSTTLRVVPLPVPGRNCMTWGSHLLALLSSSNSANTFLPCKGRGTSRRLVEGHRASGETLSARTALPSTTLRAVPLPAPWRNFL